MVWPWGQHGHLRDQLQQLQDQLAETSKREAAAVATRTAAQQEASKLTEQLCAEQTQTRQLQEEADNLRQAVNHLQQQLDSNKMYSDAQQHAEREKVTRRRQLEEIISLTQQLVSERMDHAATREQLAQLQAGAAAQASSAAAAAASPAVPAKAVVEATPTTCWQEYQPRENDG